MVMDWHSAFRDVAEETLKLVEHDRGPMNRIALLKEAREVSKAYRGLPGFSEVFEATYRCKLQEFLNTTISLSMETLKHTHTIIKITQNKLEALASRISGTTRRNSKRIIDQLTFPGTGEPTHYAFFELRGWFLTSFGRMTRAYLHRIETCFGEVYENDLKGKAFEKGCRELLKRNHFTPYSGRIQVKEPMIPSEISLALWGREKRSSDIDVLANYNNILILLECKEIKSSRIRLRETKQFQRFLTELYYKARWVATNLRRLETYIEGSFEESINLKSAEPIFLFPMLVCNLFVNVKGWEPVPLLTYVELRKLISNRSWCSVDKSSISGMVTSNLDSQSLSLPWFRCEY